MECWIYDRDESKTFYAKDYDAGVTRAIKERDSYGDDIGISYELVIHNGEKYWKEVGRSEKTPEQKYNDYMENCLRHH